MHRQANSARHARERREWDKWMAGLPAAERARMKDLGVSRYVEPDYKVTELEFGKDWSQLEVMDGETQVVARPEASRADLLLIEKERLTQQQIDQDEAMGEAASLFMVWLFRGGAGLMVSSEDVMRRLFLVVRFACPRLIERWETRLVNLLLLPGDRWKWARFALFNSRFERRFRVDLKRPIHREASLSALTRLGVGEALPRFGEVEALLDLWFHRTGLRKTSPSYVVRRVINTAYAIRPDLVMGYKQAMLGALTGQGKAAFSHRGLKMFDALGVQQALGLSKEARKMLSKTQMGHEQRRCAARKVEEATEEELLG